MLLTPVIYPHQEKLTSLNAQVQGSGGGLDIAGFIVSPSGGTLTSEIIPGGYSWSYNFLILSENQNLTIQSYDASGNFSAIAETNFQYEIDPPVILSPGIPKSISFNKASSGSTSTIFATHSGSFISDGVISGDYLLGFTGTNRSELKKIIQVFNTYLITEPFPFDWSEGDSVKIYSNQDRPVFNANKLKLSTNGFISPSAQSVLFTTDEDFELVRVYVGKSEFYDIDNTNDNVIIKVNGIEQDIFLSHGLSRTAQSIVDEINSYFNFTVAFREQESLIAPSIFYIEGVTVKVSPSNATHFFDMCTGDFVFAKTLSATGTIGTGSKCSIQIQSNTNRTISLNIDGNSVQATIPNDSELNPKQIADDLNNQAGKCVATPGPNKVVLLAENSLGVDADVGFLGLNKGLTGLANLNDGTEAEWSVDLDIFANELTLNVVGVDAFGNRTDPSSLDVVYKIDPPEFSPDIADLIEDNTKDCKTLIPIEEDILTLSGTYDVEGQGVLIDGQEVFSLSGRWTTDLRLKEGDNSLVIQTLDVFGNNSDSFFMNVQYNNPLNQSAAAEPGVDNLRWKSVLNPNFSPEDVQNAKDFIGTVFKPITSVLEIISSLLKLARAFIVDNVVSFLNVVRNAIQKFVNDVITTLKDLSRGLGIYAISTIPKKSEVSNLDDFLKRLQIGGPGRAFNGFVDQLVLSFDDLFDPKRPQLSNNVTTGGYCLAVADTGGPLEFMEALRQINRIVQKEVLDYSLPAPVNVRVSSENQRVVLTWQAADSIRPGTYLVYRSNRSGGEPQFKKIKTSIPKPGESNFTEELDISIDTGEVNRDYEYIGSIDFNLGSSTTARGLATFSKVNVLSDLPNINSNRFVDRIDFRFIDGKATPQELEEKSKTDQVLSGAIRYLDAVKDTILVQQGESNNTLVNGQTYYYKILPSFGEPKSPTENRSLYGGSSEYMATPQIPNLEFVNQEVLDRQINETDEIFGTGIKYKLKGGIFNKDTGLPASDPASLHLEVLVDGGRVNPEKVDYARGIFYIRNQDKPSSNISASYWSQKEANTTRAKLIGSEQGDFTFRRIDPEGNSLELLVGPIGSYNSNIGTGVAGKITIPFNQKITFVRDFRGQDSRTLTAREVASIIRNQTGGLKVSVTRDNKICLIDNQNADPAIGSSLEIVKGNRILGFTAGQKDTAGSLGLPPDWFRISLADLFPVINDVIRYIENNARGLLRSLEDATNALTEYIDTLIKRVETLNDIIKRLQELAERLANILSFQGGIWILEIPPRQGGTEYLKSSLKNSIGRPSSDFAGGVMFVYADGATQKALNFLFKAI